MTFANKITLGRFVLIPVFIGALMYYQDSAEGGVPQERFRWMAVGAFLLASLSDALDGFVARHFNQRSRLGAILDPLADKGLLISALIALSWLEVDGLYRIPIWFLVLVLSRDILLISGVATLHFYGEEVKVLPHWSGKASTATMMTAMAMILLKLPSQWCHLMVVLCGLFTFISVAIYMLRGIRLMTFFHAHDGGETGKR